MKKQAILGILTVSGLFALASFSGCGSDGGDVFDEDAGSSGASGNNTSNGGNNTSSGSVIGASSGASGNSASGGLPPDLEECAVDKLGGDLLPIELTLVFDKSSSMCAVPGPPDQPTVFDCANQATRWPATSTALRTFLTSQQSAGLTMAVQPFGPVDEYDPANTVAKNRCDPALYQAIPANFGPADLPSAPLADAILAELPQFPNGNGYATMTQTGPAISGALTYSIQRQTALAGAKGVAMLLVSDGDPTGCGDNPRGHTSKDQDLATTAAAAATAAGIKLYVLNIGGRVDLLDEIAAAGGTTKAITIADPTDAAQISSALNEIRGQTLSCEFPIPQPANGLKPDFTQLNVTYTPPGQAPQLLTQTASCVDNPRGWQYDNPAAPTKITLCAAVCEEVLASVTGQINVVLGCATQTGPVH